MKMKYLNVIAGCLVLVSGCSINQHIETTEIPQETSLCIAENSTVRAGFLAEVESVLADNNIEYRVIDQSAESCEWTLRYTARWTWDLALYMSYAELKVYHNGILDGEAIYDARHGSGRLDKFIDAEPKIRELVEGLIQEDQASLFSFRPEHNLS